LVGREGEGEGERGRGGERERGREGEGERGRGGERERVGVWDVGLWRVWAGEVISSGVCPSSA